jgi:hypothetical protein
MFGIAGVAMAVLALALIIAATIVPVQETGEPLSIRLLDAVGFVVIAVAIFDVSKYLLEEEVLRARELRVISEARRSLTRFVSTVIIAVLLEALVITFRVSRHSTEEMLYPALLLFAGMALLLALGAFQRMSATVEKQVGDKDAVVDHEHPPGS